MPKITLPALLLSLALAAPLPGQAPAPPYRQLIDQLGDGDYAKRRQAEGRLRAEGIRALPALRLALNHPDAEVRRRLREMVPALEARAQLAPQRVTLKLNDRPLREALDELSRQTGYRIDLDAAPPGAFRFDLKEVTFWEALDRVGRDAGLLLQPGRTNDRLRMVKRPGYAAHVCRDGAFRLTADSIQLYRELEFGLAGPAAEAPKRSELLTLTLTVHAEPRLPIVGVGEPRLTTALDNEKHSMLPPPDGAPARNVLLRTSRYGNVSHCLSMRTCVQLRRPSATATGIIVLRGTLPLTLQVEQQPAVLDDLLSAKGKRGKAGSTNYQIDEVGLLPRGRVRVQLRVTGEGWGGPDPDMAWVKSLAQRIEVQDAKCAAYYTWKACTLVADSVVRLDLTFEPDPGAKVGPPARLVFRDWGTREHLASFEFKELPLP